MKAFFWTVTLLLISIVPVFTQVKMDESFEQLLKELQITFNEPTESNYKTVKQSKNNIFNCNFSIKAKKGDLEIRYALIKINKGETSVTFPHILSMNTVNHIASNHEDDEIVVQHVTEEDLKTNFKADWAATFYFTPKQQFSYKRKCKMLALYKEGAGMVYIFFLFNKPSIELDMQFYTLGFVS